jgi:hypothetical protein
LARFQYVARSHKLAGIAAHHKMWRMWLAFYQPSIFHSEKSRGVYFS